MSEELYKGVKRLIGVEDGAQPRVEEPSFLSDIAILDREVEVIEVREEEVELEEAEVEKTDKLEGLDQQKSKEEFRKMLLSKIHPGSPLYKALQNDDNGILDEAFRINYLKVEKNKKLQSRSIIDTPSFDDDVVKENQKNLKLICDALEEAGLGEATLEIFKQSPQLLLTESAIDHSGKKDFEAYIGRTTKARRAEHLEDQIATKAFKNVAIISIQALGETITAFTDVDTRPLQERVIRQLPGDQRIKRTSAFLFNKGVETLS